MKRKKWNNREKAEFLKGIGNLIQRGYTLSNSIELFALNERDEVQQDIQTILQQLKNGDRLYDVLDRFKFPNDVLSSIYFFEHYDLAEGLIQSGNILEKREHFKSRLQKIMQYPLFLIWLSSFMFYMLFRYLFPQFSNLFNSVGSELPKTTMFLVQIVKSLPAVLIGFALLLILVLLSYAAKYRKQSPRTKLTPLLKIPFVNTLTKLIITQHFSLNFSSLLNAGISINEAFHIFERQNYSLLLQQEATDIKFRLKGGESLESIMNERALYQRELASIIKHGQMNGKLADELAIYSEMLFQRIEEKLVKALNVVQPTIFILVGLIVLLMFLSVMLPMLQFIQSL